MKLNTKFSCTCVVVCAFIVTVVHCAITTNEVDAIDATNKIDYVLNEVFAINKKQNDELLQMNGKKNEQLVAARVKEKTFIDLYQNGVRAYLANDWESCIDDLENSLSGYRDYYQATASCRTECDYAGQREEPLFAENVDNLHVFEGMIRKTACMVKCKRMLLPKLVDYFFMDKWSQDIFRTRKPYEYLQLCYFKVKAKDFFLKKKTGDEFFRIFKHLRNRIWLAPHQPRIQLCSVTPTMI